MEYIEKRKILFTQSSRYKKSISAQQSSLVKKSQKRTYALIAIFNLV